MGSRTNHFQALVARQPENELFRFSLAQALEAENRDAEAAPHYEYCAARKSDWMMPRILLGKLMLRLGQRDQARLFLEEALRLAVVQNHEAPEKELKGLLDEL